MAESKHQPEDQPDPVARPRRRPRYSGRHPRRFDQRYKELDPATYPETQAHVRAQGRTPAGTHVPILVHEVLEVLRPSPGDVILDGTVGYGGHAAAFLKLVGPTGRLVGLDVDLAELARAAQRLKELFGLRERAVEESGQPVASRDAATPFTRLFDAAPSAEHKPAGPRISLYHSHFAGLGRVLRAERLDGCHILFADLGVSSMQIDNPARGFGYKHDGPLDMRMDPRLPRSAADLLATLSVAQIAAALAELGDEPDHEGIARLIVEHRTRAPVRRTHQLVRLIFDAKGIALRDWRGADGPHPRRLHPAARTFQALRILVNDELDGLDQFLRAAPYGLRPGGRIGVLSFHSGEHERVSRSFRDGCESGLYVSVSNEPLRAGPREVAGNPRSRSARFQWAVRATV